MRRRSRSRTLDHVRPATFMGSRRASRPRPESSSHRTSREPATARYRVRPAESSWKPRLPRADRAAGRTPWRSRNPERLVVVLHPGQQELAKRRRAETWVTSIPATVLASGGTRLSSVASAANSGRVRRLRIRMYGRSSGQGHGASLLLTLCGSGRFPVPFTRMT